MRCISTRIDKQFYPKPILFENYQKINDQVKKCICKIKVPNSKEGLGFFCKIPFPDKNNLLPVLIAQSNILDKDLLEKENEKIRIIIDNNNIDIFLRDRKNYINNLYNITIIDIKDINKCDFINYLEIDDIIINNIQDINIEKDYSWEEIYIIQNIKDKIYISFGKIENDESNQNIFNYYSNINRNTQRK